MNPDNPLKSLVNIFLITKLIVIFLIIIANSISATDITQIGLIPSDDTVSVGDEFYVTVYIAPTEEIGGWQIYFLNFSNEFVKSNEVIFGSFWQNFSDPGKIDNDYGKITDIQTWTTGPYPNTNHTACVIKFTAINPGVCEIKIEEAEITNQNFENINFSIVNTEVVIKENESSKFVDGTNGYISDDDGDGIYDTFHDTDLETDLGQEDDKYLIDNDGDNEWDKIYDPETDELTDYNGETTSDIIYYIEIILIGLIIIIIIFFIFLKKKPPKKNK